MVDLVLHTLCEQAFGFDLIGIALAVQGLEAQSVVALHLVAETRHRETAFVHGFQVQRFQNFRVDHHHRFALTVLARTIHHREPQGDADLGGGEAHAGRVVHGFEHVVDQALQLAVELFDGPRLFAQACVRVVEDRHQGHVSKLFGLFPSRRRRLESTATATAKHVPPQGFMTESRAKA